MPPPTNSFKLATQSQTLESLYMKRVGIACMCGCTQGKINTLTQIQLNMSIHSGKEQSKIGRDWNYKAHPWAGESASTTKYTHAKMQSRKENKNERKEKQSKKLQSLLRVTAFFPWSLLCFYFTHRKLTAGRNKCAFTVQTWKYFLFFSFLFLTHFVPPSFYFSPSQDSIGILPIHLKYMGCVCGGMSPVMLSWCWRSSTFRWWLGNDGFYHLIRFGISTFPRMYPHFSHLYYVHKLHSKKANAVVLFLATMFYGVLHSSNNPG